MWRQFNALKTRFIFRLILCTQPSDICGLTSAGYRVYTSWSYVGDKVSGDVPMTIRRKYREFSRGLYGFGSRIPLRIDSLMNGVTTYNSYRMTDRRREDRSRYMSTFNKGDGERALIERFNFM